MKYLKKITRAGLALLLLSSHQSEAQFFWPASSSETMYPSPIMTPTTYNLINRDTKYLSNFSHVGSGLLTGYTINIDGWSTDNDGGFSVGLTSAGTYAGMDAQTIANAKEVQVGMLEFAGNYYIVASYYDLAATLYGYDLYKCSVSPGSIGISSKLYTYHFQDPNIPMPTFIASTGFAVSYPASIPITTTMDYNRISMDVNKDVNKVAIVLTDNATGKMYTAVGQAALDTVIFNSSLPSSFTYPVAVPGSSPDIPFNQYPYPTGYTMTAPGVYDLFDPSTSTYVRYYTTGLLAGLYHYSHYPIDMFQYIFEWDGNPSNSGTALAGTAKGCYSPLIGIKATSGVFRLVPPNHHYLQYWPDVAFNGDRIRYLFYLPEAGFEDLYINDPYGTGSELFSTLFNYTGPGSYGPWPTYIMNGRTDIEMVFFNTADGRWISPDHFGASSLHILGLESMTASLPGTPDNTEIRAQIDAPDMSGDNYAITFPYTYMGLGDYDEADVPAARTPLKIHRTTDYGKHNIYVRHYYRQQSILTNASLGHVSGSGPFYTAINIQQNVAPDIAFKPMSSEVSVAWASEHASVASGGTGWSYIAGKIDLSSSSPSPALFVNMPDYLYVANTPSYDCGRTPLVALSKQTDGQNDLYTSFTQDDGSNYSVMHKSSAFTNTNTWRTTGTSTPTIGNIGLNVGPNPFSQSLHIQSTENVSVTLNDITGRILFMQSGSASVVNQGLDIKAAQLVPGNYILKAKTVSGKAATFKVTKQ